MIVTFNIEKNIHFIAVQSVSEKRKEANQGLSKHFHCGRIEGFLLAESLFSCVPCSAADKKKGRQRWENVKKRRRRKKNSVLLP